MTLIVVTHAMDLATRMGRVVRIEDGKLMESGMTDKFALRTPHSALK